MSEWRCVLLEVEIVMLMIVVLFKEDRTLTINVLLDWTRFIRYLLIVVNSILLDVYQYLVSFMMSL